MNENTLKIGIEVDDKGSVVLKRFGSQVDATAARGKTSFKSLGTETNKLTDTTVKLRNEQGRFTASSNRSTASVGKLGLAFGVTSAAATALIWGIATKGLSAFASFETGMIGVQKTTDFTAREMDIFRTSVEGISREVPIATDKLLGIAGVAGQLGVKGVDNVSAFTKTLGQLELATDVVGEEGAANIARLLTVTGEGVSKVENFGDVITELGNNSAATEREILGLATEVAQATSTFSVGYVEALAIGAAMKSLGVRAELGGSVVGRAMRTIEAAIAGGGEQLERLSLVTGIAADQLDEAFGRDATAVMQAWLRGIGGAIEKGQSAADVFAEWGLKGEEVLKVLPTMAVNSQVLEGALKLANDEMERGTALDIEAEKATASLSSQWQLTKNRAGEVAVQLGEGLAPIVKENLKDFNAWYDVNGELLKQDVAGWVQRITPVVKELAGFATDVAQSFAGWAAVGSGDLDFFDFATMNAEELTVWLRKSASGVVDLEEKLEGLRGKKKDVAQAWYFTPKERQAKEARIAAINLEIKTTEGLIEVIEDGYRDSWMDGHNDVTVSHKKALETQVAEETKASRKKITLIKAEKNAKKLLFREGSADAIEAELKAAEKREDIGEQLLAKTKRLTLDEYKYKKWALDREIDDLRDQAGDDIALNKKITDYKIASLDDLEHENRKKSDKMSKEWREFADDVTQTFSTRFGDAIMESLGKVDNAWDALWKSMVASMAGSLGKMAANWATSKAGDLFDGFSLGGLLPKFHTGTWGLDLHDDELPAILQNGEMVIPKGHAAQIRDNLGGLGNSGNNFDALVASTQHKDPGKWGGAFTENYMDRIQSNIQKSIVNNLAAGQYNPMSAVGQALHPVNMLTAFTGAVGEVGIEAIDAWGNWGDFGQFAGKAAVTLGLAGGPLGAMLGGLGGFAGAFVGDAIGDALDDREFEGLRDYHEDGYLTDKEYTEALQDAQARGVAHGSVLGAIVDTVTAPFSAVKGLVAAGLDMVRDGVGSFMGTDYSVGDLSQVDFDLGFTAPNTVGAYDRAMAKSKAIDNMGGINGGWGAKGWNNGHGNQFSYQGGGSGSRADGRGTGANDQSSANSKGDGGTGGLGGYSKGGVVHNLYVPDGDHGFAPLAFNEGVVDADTMKVLQKQIRSGSLGGNGLAIEIAALRREMASMLVAVADNTRKTARIMTQWQANGMPEVRA